MEIRIDAYSVAVQLTHAEAVRLGAAIAAGYESVSRAEYYIRTGLSELAWRQIADVFDHVAHHPNGPLTIALGDGVEKIENPRRPRPRS